MNEPNNTTPLNRKKRMLLAIGLPVIISVLLALLGIYGYHQYGLAIFVFIPFFIGVSSTLIYGYHQPITQKDAWRVSSISLLVFAVGLLICAIEGAICIAMAAPLGFMFTWIGALVSYKFLIKTPGNTPATLLLLIGVFPILSFVEKNDTPSLTALSTSVEINATPETVWKNVVEFPQLPEPDELIFKTGISYPINAKIEGTGVGAVRHCNFITGSFVEPITVWNEPQLLKFDVTAQPAPLKELSFWDIEAPHLHDFFVSKQGQFKLTALPKGKTLLEGTTWYYHDIKPAFYWQVWSNYIVHKIHMRVLTHIKTVSEARR